MQLALGLIETKGLVGAIEAADAMAKAADVKIISKEKITAALVTIKISGEVAAVRSALDAGAAAAQKIGQLVSVHIIPRPDDQIDFILYDQSLIPDDKESENVSGDGEAGELSQDGAIDPAYSPDPGNEDEVYPDENDIIEDLDIKDIDLNELENLSVHKLRSMARGLKDFPIKGREISKANKQVLLDYFRTMK